MEIRLRYVGCSTARENLRVLSNTWLHEREIKAAKEYADSDKTDDQCEAYLSDLESVVSRRASFAIDML